MESLHERIIMLCQEAHIRPGRLCTDLGLSRSLISDLKAGRKKSIRAETAQKIAAYFHVTVAYLLGQTPQPSSSSAEESDILDQVDIAFYGEFKELSDQDKETVRDMVRFMRERRAK